MRSLSVGAPGAPFGPSARLWRSLGALAAAAALAACGSRNVPFEKTVAFDAGAPDDAAAEAAPLDAGPDAGPYAAGPCVDDAQCDDGIACTYDACDQGVGRCQNVPDSTQCQDGVYCDGQEQCVPGHGCEPGPVVACDDGDACELATCDEATQACVYTPRDVDRDGDPDAHCLGGHDCNDLDPDVSSLHAEVCANGIDDNCNGLVDEQPCVVPQGATCADAVAIDGAGTFALSTLGSSETYATSCSVPSPSAGQNVVAAVTVPSGPNVDLELWASTAGGAVAVAIDGACGDPTTELACGSTGATSSAAVRARARDVAPGTYFAVVTTQMPGAVDLEVDLLAPTAPPTDIDCASATPLQPGTPVTVSLVDPPTDLPTACPTAAGQLAYAFALTQPQDVLVYASTIKGSGVPVIGLRSPDCTTLVDELECAQSGTVPLYERALPAGTYLVTVGATSPIDVSLQVELSSPTATPPDQTCASPPSLMAGTTLPVDLSSHEDAIKDDCVTSGPDAAYDLALVSASDVLLLWRIPDTESGAVGLDTPACDATTRLACSSGTTPIRVGTRNVAAGDYRATVSDQLGLQGTLEALVRPTVAPTIIPPGGADTCAAAVDASSGGFFTGDTSTAQPNYGEPCDAPGQPTGGAPDQVLALNLTQPQRVVLDMEGSIYTTLLNVVQGPSCPGTGVMNACFVGFGPSRSFLDLELDAGQYWIIVDGYAGADGAWDLDVRVLAP